MIQNKRSPQRRSAGSRYSIDKTQGVANPDEKISTAVEALPIRSLRWATPAFLSCDIANTRGLSQAVLARAWFRETRAVLEGRV